MITYKGYTAVLEVDVPSGTIVGHVIGIRDELVFRGNTADEAVAGFHRTVDYYLARLSEEGLEPERPFSGRFNVRINSETHRALVLDAEARRISLNDVVKRALAAYLAPTDVAIIAERPGPSRKGGPGVGTRRRKAAKGAGEPVSDKPHK